MVTPNPMALKSRMTDGALSRTLSYYFRISCRPKHSIENSAVRVETSGPRISHSMRRTPHWVLIYPLSLRDWPARYLIGSRNFCCQQGWSDRLHQERGPHTTLPGLEYN